MVEEGGPPAGDGAGGEEGQPRLAVRFRKLQVRNDALLGLYL